MLSTLVRIVFVMGLLAVITLSVIPAEAIPDTGISDKLAHVAAYASLAFTGGIAFRGSRSALSLAAGLLLLGIGLEVAQTFIPGRSTSGYDGLANFIGIALGSATSCSINMIRNRRLRILE